jgi:hypothetical protein
MSHVPQSLISTTTANALQDVDAGYPSADSLSFAAISDASHWAQLLEQADRAHSVQAFGYGEAKASKGWHVSRQLLSIAGRPIAIVQALEKRVLGKRIATRINRGPMFLVAEPPQHTVLAVYRAVRNRWGRLPFGVLLIAPALEDTAENKAILAKVGFRPRRGNGWGSARLDLAQPIDTVFDSFDHSWRKAIRASVRKGVAVQVADSEADHQWMIERHLQNMAEKGFTGHDGDFLKALRQNCGSDYVLFKAMHDGEPVAGLVILRFGSVADSVVAWFGEAGRKVKAGNAITWGAIQEMQRRGCTQYDVGGINSDKGFASFKSGMNGKEYFLVGEYVSF